MRIPEQLAVVGVTGYTGFQVARIPLPHPAVKSPVFYVRDIQGKQCLAELFPQLRGIGEAPLRPLSVAEITASAAGTTPRPPASPPPPPPPPTYNTPPPPPLPPFSSPLRMKFPRKLRPRSSK